MNQETTEFHAWHKKEVEENGLIDIKFAPGDGINRSTTAEDFAAENNRVNRLIASGERVARPDVI